MLPGVVTRAEWHQSFSLDEIYKFETPTAKTIPALNNDLKFFLLHVQLVYTRVVGFISSIDTLLIELYIKGILGEDWCRSLVPLIVSRTVSGSMFLPLTPIARNWSSGSMILFLWNFTQQEAVACQVIGPVTHNILLVHQLLTPDNAMIMQPTQLAQYLRDISSVWLELKPALVKYPDRLTGKKLGAILWYALATRW